MRTRKTKKSAPQRDKVFFDRSPQREKLQLDLDCAIATGYEHGLNTCDIVEQLFRHAEREAISGRERGEDLSRLGVVLFGEQLPEEDGVTQ
jgi:hypothetical protein